MNEVALRRIASKLGITITGRNTHWLHAKCPLAPWRHKKGTDSNPSFNLLINEQGESYYKCFSCKSKGRISSLVRTLENLREVEYEGLANEADRADYDITMPTYEELQEGIKLVTLPPALNEAVYGDMYPEVHKIPEAVEYLKSRGISSDAAEHLDLRFDPDDIRIIFPVRDDEGELYGFTGRTILTDEKDHPYSKYPKVRDYAGLPKEFLLLGAEHINKDLPLLVVEGLFAYAHLMSIGADEVCNPVAMLGSEMTDYKADIILDLGLPTYLLPDNDDAGDTCLFGVYDDKLQRHVGGGAVSKLKGELPLFVPEWPMGKDDPDQLTLDEVIYMLNFAPLA